MSFFFPWYATILFYFGVNKPVNYWRKIQKYIGEKVEIERRDYVEGQPKHFTHAYFDKIAETTDPRSSFHESKNFQHITTSDMFAAAVDTTTTTMDWLVLYMAKEPEIQKKLQQEIDSVLGQPSEENNFVQEIPCLSHRTQCQMPLTEAVIKELLRITSVVPLGIFRGMTKDMDFYGYKIPKNTMIVANQYGTHHDPDVWPEPDKFLPERFLSNDKKIEKEMSEKLVPFGWGKRICIGKEIAWDQMFLCTTAFFQKFFVSFPDKVPSLEGKLGIVFSPESYQLNIKERFSSNK